MTACAVLLVDTSLRDTVAQTCCWDVRLPANKIFFCLFCFFPLSLLWYEVVQRFSCAVILGYQNLPRMKAGSIIVMIVIIIVIVYCHSTYQVSPLIFLAAELARIGLGKPKPAVTLATLSRSSASLTKPQCAACVIWRFQENWGTRWVTHGCVRYRC